MIETKDENVKDFYNHYIQDVVDDVTKKITYSAVNSQIMGSVTIVKVTGGGEALDGAEFSIYQMTDSTKDNSKFYGAQEGVSKTLTSYYDKQTTQKYYKVILGEQGNLKALTKAGMYDDKTKKLSVRINDETTAEYQVHSELYQGQTRFYYYTNDTNSFVYEWIIGGQEDYDKLCDDKVIDRNDKFENNGVKYSVLNRTKNGVKEYYVRIPVNPADFSQVAIVEFVNLPFFNESGKKVYYTVRETSVPEGFLALADFNQLTAMDLFNEKISNVHDFCFEVENTKQMELPITGGSGMSTTVIIGMIIFMPCLTYIAWLVIMRRRKKED